MRYFLAILFWGYVLLAPMQVVHADTLQQRIDRLHTAISAHQDKVAIQDIVIHFKDSRAEFHTESKEIPPPYVNANVVQTAFHITYDKLPAAFPATVTTLDSLQPPFFRDLPNTFTDPLHLFPNQFEQKRQQMTGEIDSSLSIEGVGKTVFRSCKPETVAGTEYEVLEFVQFLPRGQEREAPEQPELICTKLKCKLYIGNDGLIRRKTGTLYYKVTGGKPLPGKPSQKPREEQATFETIRIEYKERDKVAMSSNP